MENKWHHKEVKGIGFTGKKTEEGFVLTNNEREFSFKSIFEAKNCGWKIIPKTTVPRLYTFMGTMQVNVEGCLCWTTESNFNYYKRQGIDIIKIGEKYL